MGSRMGLIEYRHRFWIDDEMISRYSLAWLNCGFRFLFEVRTNFIIKKRFEDGGFDEIIDSEMYEARVCEIIAELQLKIVIGYRLKDYWMSDDEIQELLHNALAFAKQSAADPQHASYHIIPIVVDLDVCTVQQEGESIDATIDRAIRSEYLFPLYIFQINQASIRKEHYKYISYDFQIFLRGLARKRVENVDVGLSVMKECPICLRIPTIGAEISSLQCHHAFHYHCIVQWLLDNMSCPMCRRQVHDFLMF